MAFEPFGYGDRWQDRLARGVLKAKEFAVALLVIIVLLITWQLS